MCGRSMIGSFPRGWLTVLIFTLGVVAAATEVPESLGQTARPVRIERRGPVSADERAKLYEQLRSRAELLEAQASVVKTVAKLIGPTVVHIEADVPHKTALRHGGGRLIEEAGSGVVIRLNNAYYVLTNRHVVDGASLEGIRIRLADNRQIHPRRVWNDPDTDVAVMAVSEAGLVDAPLGDSRQMEIGDFVLAVGSPFGLSSSVTYGIISAVGRRGLNLGQSGVQRQNFIQTDAAINPGNSGGPLINLRGEVIGINTAIASNSGGSEGVGFAIPINMFMLVARQLIEKGEVRRAFLGVTLDSHFGPAMAAEMGLPQPLGTRIVDVIPNSPAATAGLMAGDVILELDGIAVEDDDHLVDLVGLAEIGREIPLLIFRNHEPVSIKLALGQHDES